TSSGAKAGVLGKRDGKVTRDEALANAGMIVEATDLPVSADLEKCFGDAPAVVAETVRLAAGVGLVGGSVEDATGETDRPLYDIGQATERVAAAAQAARALPFPFMLTARTESFLRGNSNLDDVIKRLQAFEKAGADVLMAPGLPDLAAVRAVCAAVSKPVNFMAGIKGKSFTVARGEGQGDVRLHRPLDPDPQPRRVHAGLSTGCGSGARDARTYGCRRRRFGKSEDAADPEESTRIPRVSHPRQPCSPTRRRPPGEMADAARRAMQAGAAGSA